MFPSTSNNESPGRRTFGDRLRDVLGSTIEFATLGEYGLAPRPARFVRAADVAAAPVPLPYALFGDTKPRSTGTGRFIRPVPGDARAAIARATADRNAGVDRSALPGPATAAGKARAAKTPAAAAHPHTRRLSRPVRPRRPGAVPPLPPVCTMPVTPKAAAPKPAAPKPQAPRTSADAAERSSRKS